MILLLLMAMGSGRSIHAQCISEEAVYAFTYNDHTYEVIKSLKTWSEAAACAVERNGYLVEISTPEEQDTIYKTIIGEAGVPADYTTVSSGGGIAYVWIGASDQAAEGSWIWDGDNDSIGINFWVGQGSNGTGDGSPVNDLYHNWGGSSAGGPNEPDNWGAGQDGAAIGLAKWPAGADFTLGIASEWNDISTDNELYFVVEHNCVDINWHLDVEFACKFYETPDGVIWTTSGSYFDTTKIEGGCDSVYAEYFTVYTVDTMILKEGITLTAHAENLTYQWLDCDNNYAILAGKTNRTFTPESSGNYAVEITYNSCSDTSSCYTIEIPVGSNDHSFGQFTATQGAGKNEVLVDLGGIQSHISLRVSDINGRIVHRESLSGTRFFQFVLEEPSGIYFISVKTSDRQEFIKLFKH